MHTVFAILFTNLVRKEYCMDEEEGGLNFYGAPLVGKNFTRRSQTKQ